jgi:hypothetical protein
MSVATLPISLTIVALAIPLLIVVHALVNLALQALREQLAPLELHDQLRLVADAEHFKEDTALDYVPWRIVVTVQQDEHVPHVLVDHGLHNVDEVLKIVLHHVVGQAVGLPLQVLVVYTCEEL